MNFYNFKLNKMKKLMMLSAALLAFNLTVSAGTNPEGKGDPSKLESNCWIAAGPTEECFKRGTNKTTVDPENSDCYIVDCPAPFPPCCIWMNSNGQAVIVVNEEIITFTSFEVTNPGDDLGHGASIIGYLH